MSCHGNRIFIAVRVLACRAGRIFPSERSHRKTFSRHLEFFMQWKTGEGNKFPQGLNDRQEEE